MANLSMKELEAVHRALGIIEGVAVGVSSDAASMLITAVEMIDGVIEGVGMDG